ncbi:hypothetical protein [Pseudomonas sp. EL_65y_Pfl2_R96]|uniref:hypothetical protein n=1 Tax=Pseudomonas sp. EL_65y_Pfl2_R96 TaxID=3088699 RepID=UPI0030DB78DA
MLDWFSAGVTSAQTAANIAKSLLTLRDEEAVRSRVFELTQSLMELQQQLMTAQLEQMALVKRVGELESTLSKVNSRVDLESKYQRHAFETGYFAYKLKPEFQGDEPEHYLCSNCFEKGDMVTLQKGGGMGWKGLKCPRCEKLVSLGAVPVQPPIPTKHHY